MRKNLTLASFGLAVMGLFMGSCVSKRKYMEAQTSASERYRTDSSQWATRSGTMQQNLTSVEQKSTMYQKQMDSFKTSSMNYQKRWDNLNSTYTKQNAATEQLHQQIHTALDQYVEASNVETKNGKIYVNLPEKILFTSGSSTLSSKGKQALDQLAEVIAANENLDVDIIASAAYYNGGVPATATAMETTTKDTDQQPVSKSADQQPASKSKTVTEKPVNTNDSSVTSGITVKRSASKMKDTASEAKTERVTSDVARNDSSKVDSTGKSMAAEKNAMAKKTDKAKTNVAGNDSTRIDSAASNSTAKAAATRKTTPAPNVADSSSPVTSPVTASTTQPDPEKKVVAKSNVAVSENNQGASFKSTPTSKTKSATTAPSWNLNVARSTAIVRELTQNGLPQARILLTGQNGKGITTNEWAATNRGYQVILTPKMESYYKMMQEGKTSQASTSMK